MDIPYKKRADEKGPMLTEKRPDSNGILVRSYRYLKITKIPLKSGLLPSKGHPFHRHSLNKEMSTYLDLTLIFTDNRKKDAQTFWSHTRTSRLK